jgi:hypothetical protein
VLAFILNGTAYAQRASDNPEPFSHALIGTWKSPPDEMSLSSAFDESVWGPHAKSVRIVELRVDATGHGVLTVTRRVVDGRGRTVKASTSVEQAQLMVGRAHDAVSTRVEHDVTVSSAVRTYPDDPTYKWDLAGLRVAIATFANDPTAMEVRFEPPEGTGAFWQTLHRVSGAVPRPETDQQSHSRGTPGSGTRSQRAPRAASPN